jgi:hypothetical protein
MQTYIQLKDKAYEYIYEKIEENELLTYLQTSEWADVETAEFAALLIRVLHEEVE